MEVTTDGGIIDLSKHQRTLNDIFQLVCPAVLEPGTFDGCSGIDDQIDTLWVVQLTGYAELLTPNSERTSLFEYCIDCYHRTREWFGKVSHAERKKLLKLLQRFSVKYCILTLQQPDIFPSPVLLGSSSDLVAEQLTKGLKDQLLTDFVHALAESDPEDLAQTLGPAVSTLAARVNINGVGDDFASVMASLSTILALAQHKILRPVIVNRPNWLVRPPTNGLGVQVDSLLGPLFACSLMPGRFSNVATGPFREVKEPILTREILSSIELFRGTITSYNNMLHALVLALLSSKETKNRVLDWISLALNLNKKRTQSAYEHGQDPQMKFAVADDGFHLNLTAVMLKLCKKYTCPAKDQWPPDFAKIQSDYLQRASARIDVTEETKLGAAKAPDHHLLESLPPSHGDTRGEATSLQAKVNEAVMSPGGSMAANFVTESFFMTVHELHVGAVPAFKKYISMYHSRHGLPHIMRELKTAKETQESGPQPDNSFRGRQLQHKIQQLERMVSEMSKENFSYMAHVENSDLISEVLDFYAFLCTWILSIVDPDGRGLPLDDKIPLVYATLPAYIMEDMAEFFVFVATNRPDCVEEMHVNRKNALGRFFAVFIGDQKYIRNPYILTKFVHALSMFTISGRQNFLSRRPYMKLDLTSTFFQAVVQEPTSVEHLLPSLVKFFVNIEETDSYERAGRRRQIAEIMKTLWGYPEHRQSLIRDQNDSQFTRFVMLLINDTVDQLDDARKSLEQAQELAVRIKGPDRQDDDEENMQRHMGGAKYYFSTGKECLEIFTYMTSAIIKPFCKTEVVDRLATLLNYNIKDMIVKTRNPALKEPYDELEVDSPKLIVSLAQIYVQVSEINSPNGTNESFLKAVAKDERSFDASLFREASPLVSKFWAGGGDILKSFNKVLDKVEVIVAEDAALEEDLGEIPDDYADPIMATLMTDPVILPSSKQIVDRSTIQAHLLSNPRDPFNRSALKIEEVIPADDLRKEIEAWVIEKRAAAMAAKDMEIDS